MRIDKYICSSNIEKSKEMDGYYCMNCGSFNNLETHHIISKGVVHNDSLWNLITLCHNCHDLIQHNLGYKGIVKVLEYWENSEIFRWGTALAYLNERI